MTTLGKILVIVNLLFSVVVGALLLFVYERRTNWSAAFRDLNRQYEVERRNAEAYRDRLQAQEADYDNEVKNLKKDKQDLEKDKEDLTGRLEAAKKLVKDQETKAGQADLNTRVALEEKERRRKEMEDLRKTLEAREQAILKLEEESKKNRQLYITADVDLKSTRERNEQLLAQNQDLMKDNERMRAGGGIAARSTTDTRRPPDDVEGVITEVDAKAGLVTISLGSDAGLSKGNTLEVYRLKPEPKYLGTIMLLDVRHHQAVGKPVSSQRSVQIQKGDKVATSIVAGR